MSEPVALAPKRKGFSDQSCRGTACRLGAGLRRRAEDSAVIFLYETAA